ncbi:acid phosphatase [Paenibacillus lentus]|uniref:Phosphatase PAP2 family protein n=1 Tax=Paenibacillus lentus TaxID=1338368 RepID=A0A3Q8SEM8_9BACL|nr:phosphatase PAP2 family protein [Paenibacillus lentus]AZK48990.1 phosphatase PAP2 family protein [Paenibacillus lentus]
MKWPKKKLFTVTLSLTVLLSGLSGGYASAAAIPESVVPPKASWGYFVDHYKNNSKDNLSTTINPAIGILSEFEKLWTPGEGWNTGTKLSETLLDDNIQKVVEITANRTASEAEGAYYDDRRKQSYSVIEGLGSLTDIYRVKAGATTTIKNIPADATAKKYDDEGTNSGNPESSLGNMVRLVNTLRGTYSSTNPSKSFYNYARPFRWSDEVAVLPTLIPAQNSDPSNDGGYPSGHTNAAYLTAFAMAYAVPERYQELLTRASELGHNRIVAGMHSPFDVMGGRVMATALAAAILNDPANRDLKKAAYEEAHNILLTHIGTAVDRFGDYESNKQIFTERLTYDFSQSGSTDKAAVVPKGAEVLLETRLPYLDDTQRRWVLATTALPSGYPVLDDAEGWGRLNLFAAADGYGALVGDVTVTMDSDQGGFHAEDRWRNDISGEGKLIKKGTGTLQLEGSNSYSGGTQIDEGTLEAWSETAFGIGEVVNKGGTIVSNVSGKLTIEGNFEQSDKGTLELNLSSSNDALRIKGAAAYGGKLRVNFVDGYVPSGVISVITDGSPDKNGVFSSVETVGLSSGYQVQVIYNGHSVQLQIKK